MALTLALHPPSPAHVLCRGSQRNARVNRHAAVAACGVAWGSSARHVSALHRTIAPAMPSKVPEYSNTRTEYEAGFTMPIHSVQELEKMTQSHKEKLIVVMCKSSTCKPCRAFMPTYYQLAERFPDCILLEIMGDETPALRQLMKDWKVKATPTFRLIRRGELVDIVAGIGNKKLLNAILAKLEAGERGRDWVEVTHEASNFATASSDSE